jgi:hypothetical protein
MTFQVPDETTINDDEFKPAANVIPFAPELIDFILRDLKVTTYRFGKKYDYLQIGDVVEIQDSSSKRIMGKAKITAKSSTTFKELPLNNGSHESYRDKDHQRHVLSGYYAYIGRPIDEKDEFLVFDFKLLDKA